MKSFQRNNQACKQQPPFLIYYHKQLNEHTHWGKKRACETNTIAYSSGTRYVRGWKILRFQWRTIQKATNMAAATAVLTSSEEVKAPIDESAFIWSLPVLLLGMVFVVCVDWCELCWLFVVVVVVFPLMEYSPRGFLSIVKLEKWCDGNVLDGRREEGGKIVMREGGSGEKRDRERRLRMWNEWSWMKKKKKGRKVSFSGGASCVLNFFKLGHPTRERQWKKNDWERKAGCWDMDSHSGVCMLDPPRQNWLSEGTLSK